MRRGTTVYRLQHAGSKDPRHKRPVYQSVSSMLGVGETKKATKPGPNCLNCLHCLNCAKNSQCETQRLRQVITDISDIRVTSETFEAGIDSRVSLTWDIAHLITTSLSLRKKSVERCLLRSCANVVCFPPLEPRGAHVVIYGSGTSSEMLGIGGREQREPECVNSMK